MKRLPWAVLLVVLAACGDDGAGSGADAVADASIFDSSSGLPIDAAADRDAFTAVDGRGGDATVLDACIPSRERCDGLDNDCDGVADNITSENAYGREYYMLTCDDSSQNKIFWACPTPPTPQGCTMYHLSSLRVGP